MALSFLPFFNRLVQCLARPRILAACFLLCALPTGLACALFTPVSQFADEDAHIVRAEGLRYGEVFGIKPTPGFPPTVMNAGATANISILAILVSPEPVALWPARPAQVQSLGKAAAMPWTGLSYWPTQMVTYLPVFYAPAVAGLYVGEKAGLSPLRALFAGRVMMLAAFLVLGAVGLSLARAGAPLLFAVLTLPTTVNLAASYNQDALLTATCVLAVALLSRGTRAGWRGALVALSLVACVKAPYAPLLLFCLCPVAGPGLWRRGGGVLLACVPPGLWLLHMHHFGYMVYQHAPYHPGPLWPGGRDIWLHDVQPGYNIQVLLAHPAQIIIMPVATIIWLWSHTWPLLLGMVGTDQTLLKPWEYPCLIIALAAAMLGARGSRPGGNRQSGAGDVGLALLALFATFITVELALYVTFDTAGITKIIGVEGRYFLLFLPFLVFVFQGGSGSARQRWAGWFCLPAVALAMVNVYALPDFVFHLFRATGP
jgi:Predicted membrane protein (DUF2142)